MSQKNNPSRKSSFPRSRIAWIVAVLLLAAYVLVRPTLEQRWGISLPGIPLGSEQTADLDGATSDAVATDTSPATSPTESAKEGERSGVDSDSIADGDSGVDDQPRLGQLTEVGNDVLVSTAGLRYNVTRESGNPFEKMISQARYYDLMIFGLRSLFDYDIVGTEASDVLTRLVSRGVRPILAISQEYRPIRRVLLAYSGSMESAKAIRRFMQMHLWPDLSIKVVTFEQPPELGRELVTEIANYCRAFGYEAEMEHMTSSSQQLLLQHATDWNADLIVVGNSIKHYWLKKLLGETAMHVIRKTEIPLFLSQ